MPKPRQNNDPKGGAARNGNDIVQFFHCKDCLLELPPDTSPREFVHLEVGWTVKGLQVWCVRHEKNVINLDFLGQKVQPI